MSSFVEFELRPLDEVAAWGKPDSHSLSWFGFFGWRVPTAIWRPLPAGLLRVDTPGAGCLWSRVVRDCRMRFPRIAIAVVDLLGREEGAASAPAPQAQAS